mmetsp:Transcript_11679/g.16196  ORF Transcript_11679/g.16196 Transcript_11679/m.16196 type:complete len:80 (+) Transcript_11679:145-384(+)
MYCVSFLFPLLFPQDPSIQQTKLRSDCFRFTPGVQEVPQPGCAPMLHDDCNEDENSKALMLSVAAAAAFQVDIHNYIRR